jgi:hypothetical protein
MAMLAKILRSLSPIAFAAAALTLIAPALLVAQATSSLVTTRLTQPIDENSRVTLKGTLHPLASAANDRGAAPDSMPLDRVQVVLKRSDAQESALKQLITDLHTPGSASYHKWLTPDQFGKQFGPSDQDIATLESWLQSKGFSITRLNPGKQTLEISGNVAQFRDAFHTQIHKYLVEGQTHYANAADPQIPSALAPVFGGFTSLNNFRGKNYAKVLGKATYDPRTDKATPLWTTGPGTPAIDNNYVLAPGDFAVQYDLNPLYAAGVNGSGQTIAIVNDSNINIYLANQYRTLFGLSANPPQVIIDGNDPGIDGINDPDGPNGDSVEAYLDVEQAGAVAPNATIDLVIASDTALEYGLLLAAEHAVYGNIAPVISMSFGLCETYSPSFNAAFATLWEQAAAQGITVMVSSGDSASAGCDGSSQYYAVGGQAVTGWGESAYNVSVGGTDFFYSSYNGTTAAINAQLGTFWTTAASNSSYKPSLQAVIPEQPWNNSQFGLNIFNILTESSGTVTAIAGGGGGASTCATLSSTNACVPYPKPAWQKGAGVPADSARDVPDLALYAAIAQNGSFYPECYQDGDCQPVSGGNTVQITAVGGTSASSPAFAGIMALVNQKYGRQGQADFVLYPLATQFPAAFHDVTVGSNSVPCSFSPTSPNCISITNPPTITDPTYGPAIEGQIGTGTTPEYNAGTGYDLASGLGSVDANVLVTNWGNVKFTSTTTTLTPSSTSFTHGTSITVSGSVTPTSATGDVALMTDSTEPVQQGQPWFTLKNGTYSSNSVNFLPGGAYNIWGQYSGDGTNAASTSQKTSITVNPENSGIYFNLFSPAGTSSSGSITSGASIDYGTQLLLSAQVAPSSQLTALENCFTSSATCPVFGIPTGTVAFADGGTTINTAVLNAEGDAEYNAPFAIGPHSVTAKYAGDNSYNPSTAAAVTFTVTQDTPVIGLSASNQLNSTQFANGQSTVFNINVLNGAAFNYATSTSVFPVPIASPTGTVTVTGLPGGSKTATLSPATDPSYEGREGVATVTVGNNTGTYTANVSYSGDTNYKATSTSFPVQLGSLGGLTSTTAATMSGSISPSTTVTITGTVTGQSGHGAPTNYYGGIGIFSSGYYITAIPLSVPSSGDVSTFSATLNSQTLFQGANFITLQYLGDQNYNISATTLNSGGAISNPLSDFSMVPETTIVPVTAGSSGTDTINLSSVNGFAGAVSFTCAPTPTGNPVTCNVNSSATLSAGSTSPLTLTISAGSGVAANDYNVLVTGVDSTGKFVHTLAIEAVVSSSATTPSFSLSAAPTTLSLVAGTNTNNTSTISVTPSNGFTGTVALTCAVTPVAATSPATCSLNPTAPDVTGTAAVPSTLTVDTTATTTPGTYTVTVTGTSGSLTPTTTVNLTVTAPAVPNFALSASPTTLSLTGGATTGNTSTISVTPSGGFTGNVALACSVTGPTGATSPATCSLSPTTAMVSGSGAVTSTLTVSTTSTTTAGSYTVSTTGTSGSLSSNATVTVTVTAPVPPSFALSSSGGITVTQGGSGTSTISVTPSNGFSGNVALTCTSSNSSAVSCSLNPTTADVTGTSAVTSTLTINASSNSAALSRPLDKFFTITGGAALAMLLFFGIPARRRSWRTMLGVVLFAALVGIGIGCGGGSMNKSATYTVTVTGTSGTLTETTTVSVTVSQ